MVGIGVLDISVLALMTTYSDLQTETQCLRRTILFASPLKPMDTITRQPWITLPPCCSEASTGHAVTVHPGINVSLPAVMVRHLASTSHIE
jgi:hypothetical protein